MTERASLDDSAFGGGHHEHAEGRDDEALQDAPQDLGFGSVVSQESSRRLLNRDGGFNVRRKGLGLIRSLSTYHFLLDITWPRFLLLAASWYLLVNALFAVAYMTLGPEAFSGLESEGVGPTFLAFFFFSVHTLATIGYGNVVPVGGFANWLVTLESLLGLLAFGLAAGLMFARFARPTARILFSDVAVVAPYRDITAFEFRIVNARSSQLVELGVRVVFVRRKKDGSGREYHPLRLERDRVAFFPLAWTVVHPIDEDSPLYGMRAEELSAANVEFLVLLSGFDETFSQTVHARSSYRADEIVWDECFADMFRHDTDDGVLSVDIGKLSELRGHETPG